MRRALVALGLGLVLALATPGRADTPRAPEDVAHALADGRLDPRTAAEAWSEAGLSPDAVRALLLDVLPTQPGAPGEQALELTDPHGTRTDLVVSIPPAPRADGRYGLIVILHGLRGNERQLLAFGQKIAPPGYIVAAPEAQWLAPERDGEDASAIREMLGGAGGEAPRGDGEDAKRRMQQAIEGAQRALLPHWWGYKGDGFPLLTVDAVRRRWPVDPDRVLLVGYSMGGFGTWNVGLRHPDRFAAIAPLAGGLSRREMISDRDPVARHLLGNARMVPSFFVHGSRDGTVPTRFSRTIHEELGALGANHVYEEVEGGGHILMPFLQGNELTARFSTWLAERVRDPHPRKVEHHVLGAYHGASYWVRVDGTSGEKARVVAEVVDGGRIVVTTEGVTKLTVFLDPALVPAGAPVRLEVDGRVVHEGPVAPSVEAVAESFAGRHDPSLVHTRSVTVDLSAAAPAPAAPAAPAATPAPARPKRFY